MGAWLLLGGSACGNRKLTAQKRLLCQTRVEGPAARRLNCSVNASCCACLTSLSPACTGMLESLLTEWRNAETPTCCAVGRSPAMAVPRPGEPEQTLPVPAAAAHAAAGTATTRRCCCCSCCCGTCCPYTSEATCCGCRGVNVLYVPAVCTKGALHDVQQGPKSTQRA